MVPAFSPLAIRIIAKGNLGLGIWDKMGYNDKDIPDGWEEWQWDRRKK
jgi:hypothetical protein